MTEIATTPAVPATPAAPAAPIAPVAAIAAPVVSAPPLAPVAPAVPQADAKPPWLDERLAQAKEQAHKALMRDLGITDPEEAKRIIAEHAKAQEKEKSLAQKHAEAEAKAAKLAERNAQLEAAVVATAKREMGILSPERQAQIVAAAGDDPASQSRMIAIFAPGWQADDAKAAALAAAQAAAATAPANGTPPAPAGAPQTPAAPLPPPATTAASPAGPAPVSPTTTNHLAVWEQLKQTHPGMAGAYYLKNQRAIATAQKARAGQ